jgi:hypothetical protein
MRKYPARSKSRPIASREEIICHLHKSDDDDRNQWMSVTVVTENVGVDRHSIDDCKGDNQDQKSYPLFGPEEKE